MKTVKNIITQIGTGIVLLAFIILASIISICIGIKQLYEYGRTKI